MAYVTRCDTTPPVKRNPRRPLAPLSPREQQIMEAVHDAREASVADVLSRVPNPPTYSALRTMLGRLVDKGYLKRQQDGFRYLYLPTQPRERGNESALERLLGTVFDSSPTKLVSTLLSSSSGRLTDAELDELADLIERARKNR